MIIEAVLDFVFNIVEGLLGMLPDVQWNIEGTAFTVFLDYVEMVCYLLPMGTILQIVSIVVGLITFKIVISLIKTIWDLLPLA